MTLRVYFHGFWSGFHDKTNPTDDSFFIKLLSEVYEQPIEIGSFEDAEILMENTQVINSIKYDKQWKHTYLFSGESYLRTDADEYSCVLYGQRSHKNRVNLPLYLVHLYCANKEELILRNTPANKNNIPQQEVVVIVRNPSGTFRNKFLDQLERHCNVTYAGPFRNNTGRSLEFLYNSQEFYDFVGQYKFIITMENSQEDTYITEKIMHGILSDTIPVYWGSPRITDYISSERFIHCKDENSISSVIQQITKITDEEWLSRVNTKPFTLFGQQFTLSQVAKQIRNVILSKEYPLLTQVVFLCNKTFEPQRYIALQEMIRVMKLQPYEYSFISPTYKYTITDEIYKKYVKDDIVRRVRSLPTRKSELSLTLNARAAYEYLEQTYMDGIFIVLESDVKLSPEWMMLNACLQLLKNKEWSCISLGKGDYTGLQYIPGPHPYRTCPPLDIIKNHFAEDISTSADSVRFIRKFHTRCTDSYLFSYRGVKQFVKYLQEDENYGVPFDYYMIDKTERYPEFKHYWSSVTIFSQKTSHGEEQSMIQNDIQ